MKGHYDGQKMLSQILFLEIVLPLTSTKLILKDLFIFYTHNKVVQLLNNAIVERNYIFLLKLND